ncbi:type ISP restriction/modification enzyme [Flammeovirgaceae bacterium SG7u.111]|nr:type ISP restriction/modification enzyme [Flammeovirgaceae bacterium SG7u.132]WPO33767.1 type ISP restriction/modification enzyme [Flammeovirgaceae bacterium SG7u.111]
MSKTKITQLFNQWKKARQNAEQHSLHQEHLVEAIALSQNLRFQAQASPKDSFELFSTFSEPIASVLFSGEKGKEPDTKSPITFEIKEEKSGKEFGKLYHAFCEEIEEQKELEIAKKKYEEALKKNKKNLLKAAEKLEVSDRKFSKNRQELAQFYGDMPLGKPSKKQLFSHVANCLNCLPLLKGIGWKSTTFPALLELVITLSEQADERTKAASLALEKLVRTLTKGYEESEKATFVSSYIALQENAQFELHPTFLEAITHFSPSKKKENQKALFVGNLPYSTFKKTTQLTDQLTSLLLAGKTEVIFWVENGKEDKKKSSTNAAQAGLFQTTHPNTIRFKQLLSSEYDAVHFNASTQKTFPFPIPSEEISFGKVLGKAQNEQFSQTLNSLSFLEERVKKDGSFQLVLPKVFATAKAFEGLRNWLCAKFQNLWLLPLQFDAAGNPNEDFYLLCEGNGSGKPKATLRVFSEKAPTLHQVFGQWKTLQRSSLNEQPIDQPWVVEKGSDFENLFPLFEKGNPSAIFKNLAKPTETEPPFSLSSSEASVMVQPFIPAFSKGKVEKPIPHIFISQTEKGFIPFAGLAPFSKEYKGKVFGFSLEKNIQKEAVKAFEKHYEALKTKQLNKVRTGLTQDIEQMLKELDTFTKNLPVIHKFTLKMVGDFAELGTNFSFANSGELAETVALLDAKTKQLYKSAQERKTLFEKVLRKTDRLQKLLKQLENEEKEIEHAIGKIDEERLFYYTYAILNHLEFAEEYGEKLSKNLAKIPLYDEFREFAKRGKSLFELHSVQVEPDLLPAPIFEDLEKDEPLLKLNKKEGWISLGNGKALVIENPAVFNWQLDGKTALSYLLGRLKIALKQVEKPSEEELVNAVQRLVYVCEQAN